MKPAQPDHQLSRRVLFAGAGAVGAVAAAATLLPTPQVTPQAAAPQSLPPPPERGGGYVLSEHVQRYYHTARV